MQSPSRESGSRSVSLGKIASILKLGTVGRLLSPLILGKERARLPFGLGAGWKPESMGDINQECIIYLL